MLMVNTNHQDLKGHYIQEHCGGNISQSIDFLTVEWDAAHWLDLAITSVRKKSPSAPFMKCFINRINDFPDMFSHGRGATELKDTSEAIDSSGSVVSHFSTTQ